MSKEKEVLWEKRSDADLARSLGHVGNSIMHTIKNNREVSDTLENGDYVIFRLESEQLHVETENHEELKPKSNFPGLPDAKIIASPSSKEKVLLNFDVESRENLQKNTRER